MAGQGAAQMVNPPQHIDMETKYLEELALRRFTEDVLDSRQEELVASEKENLKLAKEIENLRKELQDSKEQLAQARTQLKSKSRELQVAKDQVFRLQPQRRDITESEAQEAYRALFGNVQRWVQNRLGSVLDDLEAGRLKIRPTASQATSFVAFYREPARRRLSVWQSDEYHVVGVIMSFLGHIFFAKTFYCPLDDADGETTATWIDEVESYMSQLPRDISHCRQWRSETLAALTSQVEFKSRKFSHLNYVCDNLASILSIVVPKASDAELRTSIRRSIIDPAADLAHRLHSASNIFTFKWPARSAQGKLEVYDCLNLASGGLVLDMGNVNGTTSGQPQNVTYLFDLAPGLFVERVDGDKKSTLKMVCRPAVLVYAGDGDVPQSTTLAKWLWDYSNGSEFPPRAMAPRNPAVKSKPVNKQSVSHL